MTDLPPVRGTFAFENASDEPSAVTEEQSADDTTRAAQPDPDRTRGATLRRRGRYPKRVDSRSFWLLVAEIVALAALVADVCLLLFLRPPGVVCAAGAFMGAGASAGSACAHGLRKVHEDAAHYERELRLRLHSMKSLSEREREYIRNRSSDFAKGMHARVHANRLWSLGLRGIVVIVGVLVPVLASQHPAGSVGFWFRFATVVMSTVVAIGAALLGLFRFEYRWLLARKYSYLMERELWDFILGDDPGAGIEHRVSFSDFRVHIEALMAEYEAAYRSAILLGGGSVPSIGASGSGPHGAVRL